MYKIQNGMAPDYLCNLLPPIVGQRTTYNLRNTADISFLSRVLLLLLFCCCCFFFFFFLFFFFIVVVVFKIFLYHRGFLFGIIYLSKFVIQIQLIHLRTYRKNSNIIKELFQSILC